MDNFDDSDDSVLGDNLANQGYHLNHIDIDDVVLLAVECFIHYLNWHNLDWKPPIDIELYRELIEYRYFTDEIGSALVEPCMLEEILELAELMHFEIEEWLQMSDAQAITYVDMRFHGFIFILPPFNIDQFRHMYLWGFACYLGLRAEQINRKLVTYHVLETLINVMYRYTRVSRYYYGLTILARAYNHIHKARHNSSDDEGIV